MSVARVGEGRSILVVDDDDGLRERLAAALTRRGFEVRAVATVAAARLATEEDPPELALVDLRLPDGDGLAVVSHLHAADARTNVVVLTGYGSIATALDAVKRGATWFLTKPVHADDVLAAFARGDEGLRDALGPGAAPSEATFDGATAYRAPSLARMEWEHIQRVLADCGGNVSHAAEALGIHRRSLQRKLGKRPLPR